MEIRSWVQKRFGTADTATLLDESVYSRTELRKDKTKLEQSLRQIESEMDNHAERYQKLLQKGAEADEFRRQQYAQKAKFEKKKYEVKKKKHKTNSIKLGTVISIEGMREVLAMHNGDGESYEETGADEELELIEEMAAGDINHEQVDIDDTVEVEPDDFDVDIEDSEPSL